MLHYFFHCAVNTVLEFEIEPYGCVPFTGGCQTAGLRLQLWRAGWASPLSQVQYWFVTPQQFFDVNFMLLECCHCKHVIQQHSLPSFGFALAKSTGLHIECSQIKW